MMEQPPEPQPQPPQPQPQPHAQHQSLNQRIHNSHRYSQKRNVKTSTRLDNITRESLANDYFSEDEFAADGDLRSDRDGQSSVSSYTVCGTPKPKRGAIARRIKGAIDKRLHLELFGITWFDFAAISCARWFFLLTLLGAAAGLAVSVYIRLHNEEVDSFESEFEDLANEIIVLSNQHVESIFKIMAGVTTAMTSSIGEKSFNSIYPRAFHTMPDMEQHFGTARNASGALVVAYAPIVLSNQLNDWAAYSDANQGWIESINEQEQDQVIATAEPILPFIWDYTEDDLEHAYLKGCKLGVEGQAAEVAAPAAAAAAAGEGVDAAATSTPVGRRQRQRRQLDQSSPFGDSRVPLLPRDGPFAPLWTYSPGPPAQNTSNINRNLFAKPRLEKAIESINLARKPMLMDVCNLAIWFDDDPNTAEELEAIVAHPVFASFEADAPIVGNMIEIFQWRSFFENILSDVAKPVLVVLETSCGQVHTFRIRGPVATLVAEADVHDAQYDRLALSSAFATFANPADFVNQEGVEGVCTYTTTMYPNTELEDQYLSTQPLWFAMIVVLVFFVTSILFFLFDRLMTRQRDNIIQTAKKQNMLVSSLFPKSIQDKIMEQVDADNTKLSKIGKAGIRQYISNEADGTQKTLDKHSVRGGGGSGLLDKSKPIADLFPETTIMFGDIAGFTAWSSAREPSQVFILLETIYHEFDAIAKRRRVFKVEVVGDCYVAVCGLPDPRPDHAVVMAKFASECIDEMSRLTQELEVELGPDTTELALRVGLHSGPVVAGVLRGEKSRFQLFGDTMNTAARMESNGIPDRVQISQETADLLEMANKAHWFEARPDKIQAKGKGELTTFLLKIQRDMKRKNSGYESDAQSVASSANSGHFQDDSRVAEKRNRIADWTVEVLTDLLQEIEVRRKASQIKDEPTYKMLQVEQDSTFTGESTVIDEVKEIIELPDFNLAAAEREAKLDREQVKLTDDVVEELQDYVRTIASMYHDNPFHNFPHANHVTMSVVKLLSRIQAPDVEEMGEQTLHDHTYGITSDPLTRFAVVFSALIHDVDHMGVSNMQLVKEGDPMAELYRNQSVAEQNSIDIAWDLLMEPRFDNLRRHIYTTETEFKRFRQLVVNTVLATDIMDRDLKELRNNRWATAFSEEGDNGSREAVNRKATIVIEHLIQASDVAHTMQHWHIYRKWNERLFQEMYKAWESGRLDSDPSLGWYKGEMGFFDFYIIPLANKLKDCGVFGVSSAEYLSYATQNRKEWEARGEDIVAEMVKSIQRKKVANSVYMASQSLIDHEGTEIVAEMSRSIRRSSQAQMSSNGGELPDNENFQTQSQRKQDEFRNASMDVLHESESATASNSSNNQVDPVDLVDPVEQYREEDEEAGIMSDSEFDSEYEEELEMKLQPLG